MVCHPFDTAPPGTGHTRDAVVLGEHVVDHHRVARDQVGDRTVVHEQVCEEPYRLLRERVADRGGEFRKIARGPAMIGDEVAHAQPPGTELLRHAAHPWIGEHASEL